MLVVGTLSAYPFAHFEHLRSPNELSRLYQVRALVDDGRLAVNGPVQRYGHVGDLSRKDGRLYPNKAPGISFLGAPVYAVLKALRGGADQVPNRALLYILRFFCGVLPTLLLLPALRRWAAELSGDERAADAAVLTYGLGTLAFTYSLLFFSHQLAGVLLAAAFLSMRRARSGHVGRWTALGAALAGAAVTVEYTAAPVAVLIAGYALWTAADRRRALVFTALGALPFAVAIGAYHQAAWGHPLSTGYAYVENRTFAKWHAQGVMGVSTPRLSSLLGNLFSPARGLFAWSPALLGAMGGLVLLWRRSRADALVSTAVTAFYFFLAASFLYEAWGWMLGPRHLTPMVSFLVAPLATAIAWSRARWLSPVVAGLCVASVLLTATASVVYPHLPEEFTAGIAHVVWPLLRGGYLPYNLAQVALGRVEPWTWWLYFAALAAAAVWIARLAMGPRAPWARWLGAAGVTALVVAVLFVAAPPETSRERRTLDWIRQSWEPTRSNVRRGLF